MRKRDQVPAHDIWTNTYFSHIEILHQRLPKYSKVFKSSNWKTKLINWWNAWGLGTGNFVLYKCKAVNDLKNLRHNLSDYQHHLYFSLKYNIQKEDL